ncbi:MAG: hypothetical protein FJW38_26435 [Acidobacteria bacterium]|nr:hypothetical protein [Acidobacteriota bacterium]
MPFSTKAAALSFIAGLFTLAIYGLFNHRAPIRATLAFGAGWIWLLEGQSWDIQHCWTSRDWQVACLKTAIIAIWVLSHIRSPRPI